MNIWLIRHGESESNAGEMTSDPSLIGLTPNGFKQAKAIAQSFKEEPSLIVTSKYKRARQTAQPTLERFNHVRHEEWDTIHEFTYLSPSHCRNTTILQRMPLVEAYWKRCDPHYCDGPGAESFSDFMGRASQTLERLNHNSKKFIAVFSHQQFIAALLWLLNNKKAEISSDRMGEFRKFMAKTPIENGAVIKSWLHNPPYSQVKASNDSRTSS